MTDELTVPAVIAILERARAYLNDCPNLMLGYAVGLTILDEEEGKRYAALLEHHDPFLIGLPTGVDLEKYERGRRRYIAIQDFLRERGLSLRPSPVDASLASMIERLRA